jgi:DHA1 family multidrug resistance protein-like MFS transporter
MGALAFMLDTLFMEEMYLKTISQKRAANIGKEKGNFAIHHVSEEEVVDFHNLLHKHLLLPFTLSVVQRTDSVFDNDLYNDAISL